MLVASGVLQDCLQYFKIACRHHWNFSLNKHLVSNDILKFCYLKVYLIYFLKLRNMLGRIAGGHTLICCSAVLVSQRYGAALSPRAKLKFLVMDITALAPPVIQSCHQSA